MKKAKATRTQSNPDTPLVHQDISTYTSVV